MGSMIEVVCAECHEPFRYFKKSNVARKYCDGCAEARIQASKDRSLKNKREERREEEIARKKLEAIPDILVNPAKLVDKYINGKLT